MIRNIRTTIGPLAALAATFALGACDDGLGVNGPQNVALNFRVGGGAAPQLAAGRTDAGTTARVAGPPMVITGTNGTLTISEIRLIVAEVELEGEDDSCETGSPLSDDCADFEAPPRFIDLPLDGQPMEAFVGLIPPGEYEELEFEIEDLEDDEEDTEFAAEIAALRDVILAEFPDWPRKASALIVGTFDSGQETTSFRVYLDAEIEIERDLVPSLIVGEEGTVTADLTVDIRPDIWFTNSDGSVIPLHMYDYDATGELLEFEFEMEDGFTEVQIG